MSGSECNRKGFNILGEFIYIRTEDMEMFKVRKKYDNLMIDERLVIQDETYEKTKLLYKNLHKKKAKWAINMQVFMEDKKIVIKKV